MITQILELNTWQSWLVGFCIWFGVILLLAIFTYLITNLGNNSLKGKIPDEAFNYYYRPDFIPKDAFLLDTHSHTIASDGWMTPEQNIRWHIANGFNAFVVTDHNTAKSNKPSLELQQKYPEILIIPGYEWTTPRVHINILGVMDFDKPSSRNPSDEEIKEVIKKAHEMGGVVQLDHYTWTQDRPEQRRGEFVHPDRWDLIEWGIDGFEINNEMRWYDPKTLTLLEKWKEEGMLKKPVYIATGTDIHNPLREWATCWTEVLLTPEEKEHPTWEVVKKALLEGRTRIWVDHDWRRPPESKYDTTQKANWIKNVFAPFFGLAHGIEKVPGGVKGVVSYILWFLLAYFPLRALFEAILRL